MRRPHTRTCWRRRHVRRFTQSCPRRGAATYGSFNFRQEIKLVNLERNKGTVRTLRFRTIIGLISGPAIIAAGLGGPS